MFFKIVYRPCRQKIQFRPLQKRKGYSLLFTVANFLVRKEFDSDPLFKNPFKTPALEKKIYFLRFF